MGKPFKNELENLKKTSIWASLLDITDLKEIIENFKSPIFFIGSGGSLSACHYGVSLAEKNGMFSKAMTPLELNFAQNTIKNASIIFISASGRNSDILFGFKTAIKFEAKNVVNICTKTNSKLAKLSTKYSISRTFEYDLPVGKDGFLATNSLLSYFIILKKIFSEKKEQDFNYNYSSIRKQISNFVGLLNPNTSITVLYNGLTKSVAYDIESKSTEAALYPVLLADYRNFGHGRHHWFDKKNNAAIIALATENDEFLAKKTLENLPENIPKLILFSGSSDSLAPIDLLIQSFFLIGQFGDSLGIDPGKPGVPAFGRKLYNLKYERDLNKAELDLKIPINTRVSISRKSEKPISMMDKPSLEFWKKAYSDFLRKLKNIHYGAIIFDYDGTICSEEDKFKGPELKITEKLNLILENGFYIGIATGRGKSVRRDLQNIIPSKFWNRIIIGYYNGSDIGYLNEERSPDVSKPVFSSLKKLERLLKMEKNEFNFVLRPNQLTIEFNHNLNINIIREALHYKIKKEKLYDIEILESSHSIDIIPNFISKTNLIIPLKERLNNNKLPKEVLCIGDRGRWPGNDFDLLSTPYSLSVDEVTSDKNSCWNLSPPGISNVDATIYYLNKITFTNSGMKLKF